MKLFECIIDAHDHVFKTLAASKNKTELLKVHGGNGDFVKIQDVTKDYLNEKTLDKLDDDLMRMQWGEAERKIICALVEEHINNRK